MPNRKFSNRARAVIAAGAMLSGLIGTAAVAPAANAALSFPSFTLSVAAEGTQPTAPRFYEGFSNTINIAGSETAEYALEPIGPCTTTQGSSAATRTATSARAIPPARCCRQRTSTTITTTIL